MCLHFSSECCKVRASLPPRRGMVGTNVEKGKKRASIHKQLLNVWHIMYVFHCHSNSVIIFILQVRKLRPKEVK